MSEANSDALQQSLQQAALSKLYSMCYKNVAYRRPERQFVQADETNVYNCYLRLREAFQIVIPNVLPAEQEEEE